MDNWVIRALRGVIAIALLGSLVVQFGLMPLLWIDLEDAHRGVQISLVAIGVLGVACLQVIGVCVWRLLTLVRRGTVFSQAAFRYVDRIIAAVAAGAVLIFAIAVVARAINHTTPGDEVAPGAVGLICGLALVAGGVALLVYVLRALLAQAVALDAEAKHLQSELDEVI